MRTWIVAAAACLPLAGLADEPAAIDLTSFEQVTADCRFIEPVGLTRGQGGADRRFYLAPIVGASWGQLLVEGDVALRPSLLTAGGAAGIAVARPRGQVRLETEGRFRDGFTRTATSGPLTATLGAADNWSFLLNTWRDVGITERLGVYGGGGLGWGGHRFALLLTDGGSSIDVTGSNVAFAWQAGAGVLFAASDRLTLDVGYRFYAADVTSSPARASFGGAPPFPVGSLANQFVANELLLTLRVYEPFRRWW